MNPAAADKALAINGIIPAAAAANPDTIAGIAVNACAITLAVHAKTLGKIVVTMFIPDAINPETIDGNVVTA